MIAVLGSKIEEISLLLTNYKKNNQGICEIANDNAEGQIILSGDKTAVESFQKILENKIKSLPLKVSAPFHCSLMKACLRLMSDKINNTNFKKPDLEIISNVTAAPENDPNKIKNLLIKQIYSSVKWRESIIKISSAGVSNFIEVGPGKVLSGMVKRTIKDAKCFSINSITDIKNLKDELKDKKILITGATGGIGNCIVKKFNEYGANIVATGTNEEKLNKLKNEFKNVNIEKFQLDNHDKIAEFIEKIDKKLDGIDVLVNNAGITLDNLSIRLTEENWKKVLDINLTSTFLMCKNTIKKMLKKKWKNN